MPRGNPQFVSLGPGYLFIAPLASTEPTDLSTAWAAAWKPLGYTDAGTAHSQNTSWDPVEVAEELEQIGQTPTGRESKVSFSLAESTALNYKRAMNGGTITVTGVAPNQVFKFEPPALGQEVRTMIGFESEDHLERWVWRQCLQTGSVDTSHQKGGAKALIPMEFTAFIPSAGGAAWMRLSARTGETAS